MSLPLLIVIAVVLPLLLFVGLWLFAKTTTWLVVRPRTMAVTMMIFGVAYGSFGFWEARDGLDRGSWLFVLGGVLFFANGAYHWFRGQPVNLE